ncbi:MAG: DUF3108 domain-containing protein [Candidatus Omnitrophica bacterium]|nr:DUF3108 domain-containing protein [Candidatus Omnitrophota bacterium]
MKKRIFVLLLLLLFAAGCARTAKIRRLAVRDSAGEEIAKPSARFTVGERFTYVAAWKGIHVGRVTATIEDLIRFKGYEVYKIVVVAKTSDFLSKLFKVEDTFISYMDKDKLISRGFEATIREGRYKKDLVVDYDFEKCVATFKNLRDGTVKTCPIEENVQDPISAAYFFRTIPVKVGDRIKLTVNLNEKNYEVFGNIEKSSITTVPAIGTFNAFLVRPYIKLKGKLERRGKAWGYFSQDEKRIGLYMVVKVLEIPWIGEITATLERVEYLQAS